MSFEMCFSHTGHMCFVGVREKRKLAVRNRKWRKAGRPMSSAGYLTLG